MLTILGQHHPTAETDRLHVQKQKKYGEREMMQT